jgi:hypothetical protein
MTGRGSPLPGRMLLKLSQVLFDEHARTTIVIPLLADLQQEVQDAGDSRLQKLTARLCGYLAFWRVVMAIPFTGPVSSANTLRSILLGRSGGNLLIVLGVALLVAIAPVFGWFAFLVIAVGLLVAVGLRRWNNRHSGLQGAVDPMVWVPAVVLFAAIWPMFGWFVAAAIVSGVLMAIVLRRWNTRHPSVLAPSERMSVGPDAQINLSAIPVAGDFGGLMFVVGAFVVVILGLPDVRWFVLGSIVTGVALAGALFAWRATHTTDVPRVISILGR